jgi:RNA recognition motif-containing protein
MNTKIYVDNLSPVTTENELSDLFSTYGHVAEVSIPVDRATHRPRGFGFVTMVTSQGARAAIQGLNGKAMGTSSLTVGEAWPNEERAGPPSDEVLKPLSQLPEERRAGVAESPDKRKVG